MLSYELALRRELLRLVTFEGKNLRDAMFEARRCTELRDVFRQSNESDISDVHQQAPDYEKYS